MDANRYHPIKWKRLEDVLPFTDFESLYASSPLVALKSEYDQVVSWLEPIREGANVVLECNCANCTNERSFFETAKRDLLFPEYFGMNWNAFNDCVREFDFVEGERILVVFRDFGRYATHDPHGARIAVAICQRGKRYSEKDILYVFVG